MTLNTCIQSAKGALRKDMKNKLKILEDTDKRLQSEFIFNKLKTLPAYQSSQRISVYLSTEYEVDTTNIIRDILETNRKCFIPRYEGDVMTMLRLHSLEDYDTLPLTKWKIKQPDSALGRENAVETGGLDLVIIPGVAFTSNGCRLGHGKGYYDTFLHSLATKPHTVALAFREQILPEIPCQEHDVMIDQVIFPD